jgi:hypothetical protein
MREVVHVLARDDLGSRPDSIERAFSRLANSKREGARFARKDAPRPVRPLERRTYRGVKRAELRARMAGRIGVLTAIVERTCYDVMEWPAVQARVSTPSLRRASFD